jgi:hypothetical protein
VRAAGGGAKPAASGCGGARRRDPNLGFPATEGDAEGIHATRVSKRSEQEHRLRRGCGGAAGDDGGATLNSGEVSWSLRSTDSTTCGAGELLTSLCGSLATSRRRSDGGGKNPTAAALDLGLGFRWRLRTGQSGSGRRSRGGGRLIRAWGDPLACAPCTGRRAPVV